MKRRGTKRANILVWIEINIDSRFATLLRIVRHIGRVIYVNDLIAKHLKMQINFRQRPEWIFNGTNNVDFNLTYLIYILKLLNCNMSLIMCQLH